MTRATSRYRHVAHAGGPIEIVDRVGRRVLEGGLAVFAIVGERDPGLESVHRTQRRQVVRVAPLGVGDPRPAVIQLTAPGSIVATAPVESRCTIRPAKRYVSVESPMWGCARAGSRLEVLGADQIGEDERTDHAASAERQHSAIGPAADVRDTRLDDHLDGARHADEPYRSGEPAPVRGDGVPLASPHVGRIAQLARALPLQGDPNSICPHRRPIRTSRTPIG